MFCSKCGSPVNEGEKFCSVCGQMIETAPTEQLPAQPIDQQPYGQQPLDQQQYTTYSNVPKKSKKGLWITLGLVAVLAIAAVLIFVGFGNNQAGLFKGNTPQTQFANNTVRVFSDAFAGFGNEGIDIKKLAEQPFDVNMDITANAMGQTVNVTLDAAYDKETLGLNLNAMGSSIKLLLLKDVLYMDTLGSVTGIDFNSTADLSKSMSLQDRLTALVEDISPQKNMLSEEDYIVLAELFLNSIDEKCFESSSSKTTLTLHADDVISTLRTFAGKLDANKELKTKLEDYIKTSSGTSGAEVDVVKEINGAADQLEAQKDTLNFVIVWEISFENGKPVSFALTVNDGTQEYVLAFGYEKTGDSTNITFELAQGSSSTDTVTGSFSYKKTSSGLGYEGSITMQGQAYTLSGTEKYDGNKANGIITINIPGTGEIGLDYKAILSIGMPGKGVKDDERFKIDTSNATIKDASSIFAAPIVPAPALLPLTN